MSTKYKQDKDQGGPVLVQVPLQSNQIKPNKDSITCEKCVDECLPLFSAESQTAVKLAKLNLLTESCQRNKLNNVLIKYRTIRKKFIVDQDKVISKGLPQTSMDKRHI